MSRIVPLFHAAASQFQAGRKDEAARVAGSALVALFENAANGREVLAGFYPMAIIRDVSNESHVRFDLRGNFLRIVCATEMLSEHFTNYYEAFVLAAALIQEALAKSPLYGGFTMDLGNGSNVDLYPRVAFSSALPQAALVMAPVFFHSNGYQALRETCQQNRVAWRDRNDLVFWRGKSTGIPLSLTGGTETDLHALQRLHLCDAARRSPHARRLDVGLSEVVQVTSPHLHHAIAAAGLLRGPGKPDELLHHRYTFVLDGNTSVDNGLVEAMLSGTCVLLIQSKFQFRSWFYSRLGPEQTHVPIRADLSDLDERLTWVFDNPHVCERIAAQARALAEGMSFQVELRYSTEKLRAATLP